MQLAKPTVFLNNMSMHKRLLGGTIVAIIGCVLWASVAYAVDPKSSNYQFNESSIGTGGLYGATSTSYQATSSTTDIAVGTTSSGNYKVVAGTQTPHDPSLSFSVNSTVAPFGQFAPSTTQTATTTFSVSNYTTYGYAVQVYGPTPTMGSHSLTNMSVTGLSQKGVEQFGINLVANTLPVSFGTNPDNGQFGFGSVAANYNTPNNYRYVSGETVAQASKDSGITNYTISYIVNVTALTAGGTYTANQTIVVTGTY